MSGLNLTPNPMVIAVQGGIFLSALLIIKKNFLQPYMALRQKRDQMTTGVKGSAEGLTQAASQMTQKIQQSTETCLLEVRKQTSEIREQATQKRVELVQAAESEAATFMAAAREDLRTTLREETTKVEVNAKEIAKNIESLILN